MLKSVIIVGIGGFIGSALRYLVSRGIQANSFGLASIDRRAGNRISVLTLLLLLLFIPFQLFPQWSSDPSANTIIADGLVNFPKIKNGRDFYYTSYFKSIGGVSLPFLCKLNYDGFADWPGGDLLITDSDLPSYPGQYDLQVDHEGNALIVIQNEIANQSRNYLTLYKISPSGEFLWNPSVIRIQPPADIVKIPQICLFPDNSFAIMALGMAEDKEQTSMEIWIRKYTKLGEDEWEDEFVNISSDNAAINPIGFFRVRDNGLMVIYSRYSSVGSTSVDYGIYASKIDQNGKKVWDTDKKLSQSNLDMVPEICLYQGHNDEVFVAWKSKRVNLQGIHPDGSLVWEYHPVAMTYTNDQCESSPSICGQDSEGSIYMLWSTCVVNSNENDFLMGQKISLNGDLLWEPTGNKIVEGDYFSQIATCIENDTIYISFKSADFHLDMYTAVKLVAVDGNGGNCWREPVTLNTEETVKASPQMPGIVNGQGVVCFRSLDYNSSSYGKIKIQNFWPDGAIGPKSSSSSDLISNQNHPRIEFDPYRNLIEISGCSSIQNIMLFDITGKVINQWFMRNTQESHFQLNCPHLAPGIYYLRLVYDHSIKTLAIYLNYSN
jgi:hypothetical protein